MLKYITPPGYIFGAEVPLERQNDRVCLDQAADFSEEIVCHQKCSPNIPQKS